MIVHLQSGFLQKGDDASKDSEMSLERNCMLVYQGVFESMDGEVEVSEADLERLERNHNSLIAKLMRMAGGNDVPAKTQPPVQLDHSRSARDTVGRVVGSLSRGTHTLEDGRSVQALFGKVRILGKENVERVKDGRWTHLSIGADLEEGKLTELTITPFPAAAEASMLRSKNKETGMFEKLVKLFMGKNQSLSKETAEKTVRLMSDEEKKKMMDEEKKLSNAEDAPDALSNAEDAPDALAALMEDEAKMSAYLMDKEDMSEEDAKEKLKAMEDSERKNLAKRCMDDEKKEKELSNAEDAPDALQSEQEGGVHVDINSHDSEEGDEDLKKKGLKMTAGTKKKITALAADFRKKSKEISLSARKAQYTARVAQLRADGKITPAEAKKFFTEDRMTKLAKANAETVKEVFESYESREPVIMAGVYGSNKATSLAELTKLAEKEKLENETRANMPSLSKGKTSDTRLSSHEALTELHSVSPQYRMDYEGICRLMDDKKIKEAKVALKKLFNDGNIADKSNSAEVQLSGLAKELEKLENQYEQLLNLVIPKDE